MLFVADAVGPEGTYLAAFTETEWGDPNSLSMLTAQNQQALRNLLNWLVRILYEEGWQSVQTGVGAWYNHRFRRRIHDPKAYDWCLISLEQTQEARLLKSAMGSFYAEMLNGPNRGERLAEASEEFRVKLQASGDLTIMKSDEAEPCLADLVAELEDDGWEYLHDGTEWWGRAFRRPRSEQESEE